MKYFALIDELFNFKYLLTEDSLNSLSDEMKLSKRIVVVDLPIQSNTTIEEIDSIARSDRNIKLYFNIIKNIKKDNKIKLIDDINKLSDYIKLVSDHEYDSLITNISTAAWLVDRCEFVSTEPSEASTISRTPYHIGNIGKLRIFIDPYMKWDDTRLFIYTKNKIEAAVYFDDVSINATGTSAPISSTKMIVYSNTSSNIETILINIPSIYLI